MGAGTFAFLRTFLLAFLPDLYAVDGYIGAAGVACFFSAKSEQSGAGYIININAGNIIIAGDVEYVLVVAHIAVVNVQHRLLAGTFFIIHSAVFKVDRDIMFSGTIIRIDVYDLARGIKGAVVKCVLPAGFCPKGIICTCNTRVGCTGSVEGNIFKFSRFISPVVSTSIESAIF